MKIEISDSDFWKMVEKHMGWGVRVEAVAGGHRCNWCREPEPEEGWRLTAFFSAELMKVYFLCPVCQARTALDPNNSPTIKCPNPEPDFDLPGENTRKTVRKLQKTLDSAEPPTLAAAEPKEELK